MSSVIDLSPGTPDFALIPTASFRHRGGTSSLQVGRTQLFGDARPPKCSHCPRKQRVGRRPHSRTCAARLAFGPLAPASFGPSLDLPSRAPHSFGILAM